MILCFSHCSNGCTKSGSFADYLSLSLSVCVSTSSSLFLSALLSPILPFPPLFLVCLHFLSSFSSLLFLYTQFLFFFFFASIFSFLSTATFRSPPTLPTQPHPLPFLSLSLLSSPSIPTNNLDFFFSSPFPFLPLYSPSSIRNRALTFLFPPCPLDSPPRAHHPTSPSLTHSLSLSLSPIPSLLAPRTRSRGESDSILPSWPCTRSPISPARPVMAGSG